MKKFIGLIVVLCILLCTLTVAANEPPHSNVTWNFENGILTIKGTGAMDNYRNESDAPWYAHRSEITKIVVEEGITHIGNMAFYGLKNAKEAHIASASKIANSLRISFSSFFLLHFYYTVFP